MALKRSISVVAALRQATWVAYHYNCSQGACPVSIAITLVASKRQSKIQRSPLVQHREKHSLTFLQTSLVSLCAKKCFVFLCKKMYCYSRCKSLFDFCTRLTVRAVSRLERGSMEETGQDWALAAFDHLTMDNDDN